MPLPATDAKRASRRATARCVAACALLALALCPVAARAVFAVDFPWVRPATRGGATEAFMELTSVEGGALVGARSDVAARAYLAGPGKEGAAVASLPLPAGAPVVLTPGSYRVRLTGLARTLKLGERVPIVLVVEDALGRREEVAIDAEVRRRSTVDDHLQAHHRH